VKWWQAAQTLINAFASIQQVTQANLPTLTSSDSGVLIYVTDYAHLLIWTGTGWTWGPGEPGSDFIQPFLNGPNPAIGWHLCDGSTINRLNFDGSLTKVTLPNLTVPAYLMLGTASAAGPNAASGQSGAESADANTGVVATPGFDITLNSDDRLTSLPGASDLFPAQNHTHGPGSLSLVNTQLLAYYRQ
jgi:hypothetical protein